MTQPPYGDAGQQPGYPPPVDPFAVPPAAPPPPGYGQYPPAYGQPAPSQPYPQPNQPMSGQPYPPPQPVSGQPYPPPYAPTSGFPQYGAQPGYPMYPGGPVPGAPKKRRGLMIASIALVAVLVLCGGGGLAAFLLLRNVEPNEGAAEPVIAVEEFLKAVYTDQDAAKATELVCAESRDESEITEKVDEVKSYATKYKSPRFKWGEPKVDDQNAESANVSVKVTMTTADEKTSDQNLRFTVVQKTGWFVCEIGS